MQAGGCGRAPDSTGIRLFEYPRVTGHPKATLGQALKVLGDKAHLHKALELGFSNIYGYTSDADGIRHGMMELPELRLADAPFMLVACSAFANYLLDRAADIGPATQGDAKTDAKPP
jgi:hypothetical protein